MELVQELFLTAFVAIVFSVLVAKLVSIAVGSDGDDAGRDVRPNSSRIDWEQTVVEEVMFDRGGLRVDGTKSRKRVQFVKKIDEFKGQALAEMSRFNEEFVTKCCDSGKIGDVAGGIEVDQSSREVSEMKGSSKAGFGVEEVKTEILGSNGSKEVKEENIKTELEGLVTEERSKSSKVDEFCCEERENLRTKGLDNLVVRESIGSEKTIENISMETESTSSSIVDQSEKTGVFDGKKEVIGIEGVGLSVGDNDEDDDWEGIERSELEKTFAMAVNYVNGGEGKDDRLSNLGSDVRMQLNGLQKVAMEGPCYEPQPMALKVFARAKWHAWQRLGNLSPETAMEQYISILSDRDPGWMQNNSPGKSKTDSSETAMPGDPDPNISTFSNMQANDNKESEMELKGNMDGGILTGDSNSVNKDKEE